jgi:hypothetical protein
MFFSSGRDQNKSQESCGDLELAVPDAIPIGLDQSKSQESFEGIWSSPSLI